jgi:hypothetical protein
LVEGNGAVTGIAAGGATDGRAVGRIVVRTREEHGVGEVESIGAESKVVAFRERE